MPLPATLGTKAPGQLIKSDDWNALVAGVNAIESALDARITTLQGDVAALDTRLGTAETDIVALRGDVDEIVASTFRITLETARLNFAMGETAIITATVRDLRGAIPAPVNGERPWVDFVTTWGHLRPESGFTARAGAAERTISVQTDASGVARVRIAAEIVEDMSDETEAEMTAVLDRRVGPQNRAVRELVLEAQTPADNTVFPVYQSVTSSYDSSAGAVRGYLDSYYFNRGHTIAGKIATAIANQRRERWRDHRVTVLAFGKADADPRTPDPSRGSNAIQITFRDWVGPWIVLGYMPTHTALIPGIASTLRGSITTTYAGSVGLFGAAIQERVQGLGLIGKTRQYEAIQAALEELAPTQPPAFLPQLRESIRSAVLLQHSFQQSQAASVGGGEGEVAFRALTDTGVRADSAVADVQAAVGRVESDLASARQSTNLEFSSVRQSVNALGGRLDATLAEGGQLQTIRSNLTLVTDQIQALRSLGDPSAVTERLNLITSLDNRLARLERG